MELSVIIANMYEYTNAVNEQRIDGSEAPATNGGWPNTFALSPLLPSAVRPLRLVGGVGGGFEDAWRDVLVVAYEKASDTTMVVDSALYHTFIMMQVMFPDSTFDEPTILDPEWTSTQRTTLEFVASQCPTEYGVGVYVARGLATKKWTLG